MNIGKKAARIFGKRIRSLRKAKGWSQERLAVEAGISTNYIGEIERAECNISLYNIAQIANAFQLSIDSLFNTEPIFK